MDRATTFVTGALAGVATVAGLRYYRSRATETVEYERRQVDGCEIRQYPTVVIAETVAKTESAARRRLEQYLDGANTVAEQIPATTPLRAKHKPLEVTTPQTGDSTTTPVRVSTYLPPTYSPQTAPEPTDHTVQLTVETPRTVAVQSVSLYPSAGRLERTRDRLFEAVEANDWVAVGSPVVFRYDNSLFGSLTGRTEVGIEIA